jgi:hypothetical protein
MAKNESNLSVPQLWMGKENVAHACTIFGYKKAWSWKPVADSRNPSYSGGRDQEDRGSKPARANSSQDPISKNLSQKKRVVEWLKV